MGDRPTIVEHRIYTVDTFYCLFFCYFFTYFQKKNFLYKPKLHPWRYFQLIIMSLVNRAWITNEPIPIYSPLFFLTVSAHYFFFYNFTYFAAFCHFVSCLPTELMNSNRYSKVSNREKKFILKWILLSSCQISAIWASWISEFIWL